MHLRHQVFVSSTYLDLKEERQAAVEAILRASHIPAGMELFAAEDRRQLDVIKTWIDESDIYCLIVGSRYGSIEPDSGLSYTEFEYRYALEQGKPAFALVLSDAAVDAKHRELGARASDAPDKLKAFKAFVMQRIVRTVDNSDQIKLSIQESIQTLTRNRDVSGWCRADQNYKNTAAEIARLSAENHRLTSQLAKSKTDARSDVDIDTWIRTLKSIEVESATGKGTTTLLTALMVTAEELARGVSNQVGQSPVASWLYFEVAGKLAALGLAEQGKVPSGVHWTRLILSKQGIAIVTAIRHLEAAALATRPEVSAASGNAAASGSTAPKRKTPKKKTE
jgi:hypothetical protein